MHGCNFTRFTVPATGDYILAAKMSVCDGTTVCAECESEAYLYVEDPPSLVDCVHTGPCCGAQQIHYTLSIDRTYLLYCCKVACVIHQADCDDCDAPCVAWATVQ